MASLLAYEEPAAASEEISYPSSDGNPMAENTLQCDWIIHIRGGLDILFADRPDVFVASDLLWYYAEGKPWLRVAPDVMVVFGRPKGPRPSYKQWEEGNLPFQVVFEILSPSGRGAELGRKLHLYEQNGVMEYYAYDPGDPKDDPRDTGMAGWHRDDPTQPFQEIEDWDGWRSPRLGVTFEYEIGGELRLFYPDGRPFESIVEIERHNRQLAQQQLEAEQRAQQSEQRAQQSEQRAQQSEQRAQQSEQSNSELLAKLLAAGIDLGAL